MREMGFKEFHDMNVKRCEEGFGHKFSDPYPVGWTHADWITATVGELGELANLLKKQRRGEDISQEDIENEWADTFIYLDLLAQSLGINTLHAILHKFNIVSERIGYNQNPSGISG